MKEKGHLTPKKTVILCCLMLTETLVVTVPVVWPALSGLRLFTVPAAIALFLTIMLGSIYLEHWVVRADQAGMNVSRRIRSLMTCAIVSWGLVLCVSLGWNTEETCRIQWWSNSGPVYESVVWIRFEDPAACRCEALSGKNWLEKTIEEGMADGLVDKNSRYTFEKSVCRYLSQALRNERTGEFSVLVKTRFENERWM